MQESAQSWGAQKVIGVDIDDSLIRAAWRRRRTVWSLQEPSEPPAEAAADDSHAPAKSKKRKRESPAVVGPMKPDYFPISCEHTFGPLPIPPSQNRGKHVFPHNLSFRTADWIKNEIPEDTEGYDVVIASVILLIGIIQILFHLILLSRRFSISKWIHLNGGDEALITFFRRVHTVLKEGGKFILEPQAWDTYGKAKRMDEVCNIFISCFIPNSLTKGSLNTIEIERKCQKSEITTRRV